MSILEYETRRRRSFRMPAWLWGGVWVEGLAVLRGLIVAYFVFFAGGGSFSCLVQGETGEARIVMCDTHGGLILMSLGSRYGYGWNYWSIGTYRPQPWQSSQMGSILASPARDEEHFGFAVRNRPFVEWVVLPFWLPAGFLAPVVFLLWRKVRADRVRKRL